MSQRFWIGLGRAFGGAIIFSLPLMMTMEMWWIGFYIDHYRLIALVLLSLPLFYGLSRVIGFKDSTHPWDDVIDVFVAYAVGLFAAAIALSTFAVITTHTQPVDATSMILLQSVPASMGALLARSELEVGSPQRQESSASREYADELVILAVGALFLAFNIAPTEEILLVSTMMSPWHGVALFVLTVMIMQAFVIASVARDRPNLKDVPLGSGTFARYTCVGYVIAFGISAFMLWTFGRTDNADFAHIFTMTAVLAFPAGVGASASRLIL